MNPFKFGTAVSGKYFVGRTREIKALLNHVQSHQNVLLYADRKIGKTSLLLKLKDRLPGNFEVLYIDLWGIKTTEDFCLRFLHSLEKVNTFKNKLFRLVKIIKSLRPTANFDDKGSPNFSFSMIPGHQEVAVDELMELFRKILGRKNGLLIFDEFQEIASFDKRDDHYELKGKLRSVLQFHQNISSIYCGSKKHILLDMFDNKNEPFYESALKFPLGNISIEEFSLYINKQFKTGNRLIDEDSIKVIFARAEGVPNYIQQLCYFVYDCSSAGDRIDPKRINSGLNSLLDAENPRFSEAFHQLTKNQQKVLQSLAATTTKSVYSKKFLETFQFKSSQEVRDAIKALCEKDILFRDEKGFYQFKTIWFKYWVQKT